MIKTRSCKLAKSICASGWEFAFGARTISAFFHISRVKGNTTLETGNMCCIYDIRLTTKVFVVVFCHLFIMDLRIVLHNMHGFNNGRA